MKFPELSWSLLYLVSEWSIRIAMLLYVPQRRTPAAARAWLLLIFFLPMGGLALYALVGRIYVPRQRIALQRQASHMIRAVQAAMPLPAGAHVAALPEKLAGAVKLAAQLGDFVAVGGNRCELLPGYDTPLNRLLADLVQARDSIHLLYYIYEDDATGARVTDALCAAAARGVACRVLMDAVGSRRALATLAPRLRDAGVEVRAMLPVGLFRRNVARFDLRNHRKVVVIDGRLGYTGSQNVVDATFIPGCPNEELVVRLTGPAVAQLQGVFLGDWFFETGQVPADPSLLPEGEVAGDCIAQVLPSGPGYGRENTKELMIALFYAARREIVMASPYFVPDAALLQALLAAARRGVSVHLILPLRSNQRITHLAQQSYYEELLRNDIHIYRYAKRFLHAKHLTIDGEIAMIGSTNLDIRSFALNAEVSLLAYDATVAGDLRDLQQHYIDAATELRSSEWSARPWSARALQNIARLADSLL